MKQLTMNLMFKTNALQLAGANAMNEVGKLFEENPDLALTEEQYKAWLFQSVPEMVGLAGTFKRI